MQPTLCTRCHKNVAVIFIQKMEGGTTKSEGLCLKCAKEMGIKPVEDMMQKMGITDEDLEGLTNEMMSAFGGAVGMEGLVPCSAAEPRILRTSLRSGRTTALNARTRTRRAISLPSGSFWRTTASP